MASFSTSAGLGNLVLEPEFAKKRGPFLALGFLLCDAARSRCEPLTPRIDARPHWQRRSRERKALGSAQRGMGLALREGGSVALGARVGPLGCGVLDVRSGRVTFIDGSWGFELSREVFFWRCYGSRTRLPEVENEAIPPSSVVRIGPSGRGLVSLESALGSSLF